jgi:flagellar protein FliS
MHNAAHAYLQTRVTTTGQGDVLLLLYDGGLNFLHKAKDRLEAKDMGGKGVYISKALDIVEELTNTLDMEAGGLLAQNLLGLYRFCTKRLIEANIKKSPEIIDEVIKILEGLRGAFASIVNLPEAMEAAAQVAAGQKGRAAGPVRAGFSSSGTIEPTPGAGARRQSLYAKNMALFPSAKGQADPETEIIRPPVPAAAPGPEEKPQENFSDTDLLPL